MKDALVMMTRIPVPGATKTRMMPPLTPKECAVLHTCFLKDYDRLLKTLGSWVEPIVYYAPENATSENVSALPLIGERIVQRGETLGERMSHVFNVLFGRGYDRVILVGTDIPQLLPGIIVSAFDALQQSDVVLGPTSDGGYYLVGKKRSHPALFNGDLAWGGLSVMEMTLKIAEKEDLQTKTIECMTDIDTMDDLLSLLELVADDQRVRADHPMHTLAFLKNWLTEKGVRHG